MKRAAVVIGVNNTGQLTPLTAAAKGATRVAEWLENEGFAVKCLTDREGPVTASQVEEAVASFVTAPPRYSLLVVYFSGHGYWRARSDIWLLSGAPARPNEAINLESAMDMAKYSGIPNVVFISDACRSIPNTRATALVEGGSVFPNLEDIAQISKIDYFKATSEALPAYEGPVDGGEPQSLLTAALIAAYQEPEAYMVREIVDGANRLQVVPNRRLEGFLQSKVDALLGKINVGLSQSIEVNVPSSDDTYLARVRRPVPPAVAGGAGGDAGGAALESAAGVRNGGGGGLDAGGGALESAAGGGGANARSAGRGGAAAIPPTAGTPPVSPQVQAPDPGRAAAAAISRSLSTKPFSGARPASALEVADPGTQARVMRRLPDASVDHFESECGFVVRGARVHEVAVASGPSASGFKLLEPGDGGAAAGLVRIDTQSTASVVLQISGGRCVILAALAGYIGHLTFNDQGLSNVSYVPSSNHWRWNEYIARRAELDQLRALVALAVDRNTFRVRSNREANELAERIRNSKGVDPTLGLYAAYAYSQAGNDEQLRSIQRYIRDDLNADLFDVRLLANRTWPSQPDFPLVPFCPMLTQSWHLLRPRRALLHETLRKASTDLCGSLWATFEPDAAGHILDAVKKGELR